MLHPTCGEWAYFLPFWPHLLPCPCLQVRIPHVNWQHVFESTPSEYAFYLISKGYCKYVMPSGLQVRCC